MLSNVAKSGHPRKIDAVVEDHMHDVLQFSTPNLKAALEEALENKVETLRLMAKYRGLAPKDYASFETLCKSIENILRKIGQKHQISFA